MCVKNSLLKSFVTLAKIRLKTLLHTVAKEHLINQPALKFYLQTGACLLY